MRQVLCGQSAQARKRFQGVGFRVVGLGFRVDKKFRVVVPFVRILRY